MVLYGRRHLGVPLLARNGLGLHRVNVYIHIRIPGKKQWSIESHKYMRG